MQLGLRCPTVLGGRGRPPGALGSDGWADVVVWQAVVEAHRAQRDAAVALLARDRRVLGLVGRRPAAPAAPAA